MFPIPIETAFDVIAFISPDLISSTISIPLIPRSDNDLLPDRVTPLIFGLLYNAL